MAGKKKDNMFNGFGVAAQQRKEQQEKIEAAVTGKQSPRPGRPVMAPDKTTITLSIRKEDKSAFKRWAMEHETTMSDMLHDWITKNCVEG